MAMFPAGNMDQSMMNNDFESSADGMAGSRRTEYLSPLAVIALSFGYAVGWGSFVLPGKMFLPNAGPAGTIIGLLIGTAVVIVLAYNYHKVLTTAQIPGGAYGFVEKIFGRNHGFLVGWFLFLTYMAILWGNATALVLLMRYLFGNALQFGFHYSLVGFNVYFGEVLLSLVSILFCGIVCMVSKRFAIRLHTFFVFVLILGVLICFTAAILGHKGGMEAMLPAFSTSSPEWIQILRILAVVPWAFVGFEAVIQSSSEFRFPIGKLFSLMLAAILISVLIYIFLVTIPVLAFPDGYSNWEQYIKDLPNLRGIDAMPVFSAAKKSLGSAGVAVIGGAMFAAQLTALFATYITVSRLMCSMANDDMLPKWFGKCSQDGNPVNSILFVMCMSLPIPFLGRTVIGWPIDLSNLGAAIAYGYTSAAVLMLLKKEKNGGRPLEKASGFFGLVMSGIFCLLTLVPNYLSGSSLSTESYLLLAIWCFVGFLLYRRDFIQNGQNRFGHSTIVWIAVLIVIFFSSLMWFRLAVCDSAENAFEELTGQMVTSEIVQRSISYVNADMLIKSIIEFGILIASLAIILNLVSILHLREDNLIEEKLKAEESASKSKSYFFSTISHDIRTPLNAVIGYSQMLKMGFRKEEDREQALDAILTGGQSLLRLINDAIDFAKLEDGCMEFELNPTDCPRMFRKFTDAFRIVKQIQLIELRCKSDEMPTLLIDQKHIQRILFHLMDNAAKFTRQGFAEVRASFEKSADSNTGTLHFEVEDTGYGISKDDLERISAPYVQVDAHQSRHGGTGIGLAICRKLTEAMGGELSIASELGKGSTFSITIPNVKITEETPVEAYEHFSELNIAKKVLQQKAPAEKEEKTADAAVKKRILIADDQKVNLIVLNTMLKKLGAFDIVMAKNGKEALDILTSAETPFDLVLTDMWMPVMDGEGFVRAVRANEKYASIPVHVVTADTEMPGKYKEIGFDGILLKPVTVDKLKDAIG